jgi:hypothetical protein
MDPEEMSMVSTMMGHSMGVGLASFLQRMREAALPV